MAIRENRDRVTFSGLKVWHHQLINFVIAGFFAGIAGSLLTILNRAVFPEFGYWTTSASVVLMCILGGVGVFIGPLVGAAIITLLEHYISLYTYYWQFVLGLLIILFVLFMPGGISGFLKDRFSSRTATKSLRKVSMFLQIKNLQKTFGRLMAVYDVNLNVEEGERLAVIGPNGAGKSTFFNLLSGYYSPDAGEILFKGRNLSRLSADRIVRRGVGRSFQIVNIYPELSVFESVQMTLIAGRRKSFNFFSSAEKMFRKETEEILGKVGLQDLARVPGGLLSHGDKKRLEIGMVLANNSQLILLDEPTAGMAPDERLATMALINESG